jgi:hypothetical protein
MAVWLLKKVTWAAILISFAGCSSAAQTSGRPDVDPATLLVNDMPLPLTARVASAKGPIFWKTVRLRWGHPIVRRDSSAFCPDAVTQRLKWWRQRGGGEDPEALQDVCVYPDSPSAQTEYEVALEAVPGLLDLPNFDGNVDSQDPRRIGVMGPLADAGAVMCGIGSYTGHCSAWVYVARVDSIVTVAQYRGEVLSPKGFAKIIEAVNRALAS